MSVVSTLIAQEIALVSRFIATLSEEQDCLKAANANALADICNAKSILVAEMNQLEAMRMHAIGHGGMPSDQFTMNHWLSENPSDEDAAVNWKKLLKLATEAKSLHEINGGLVNLHLRNATEALAILSQHNGPHPLYGASGQSLPTTGSRIVDSA